MPELPEVETTCRAIAPFLLGEKLVAVEAFVPKLRYPIPDLSGLAGQKVVRIRRRAKYILIELSNLETLVIHLGMSGRMTADKAEKHAHFAMRTAKHTLYLHDPRRFGLVLRLPTKEVEKHPLLKNLGPEPLEKGFTGHTLKTALVRCKTPIKPTLMKADVVVGVGNIYASESLFEARISPKKSANTLTLKACERLVACIKRVLERAVNAGGSTLRDFAHADGRLGNFQNDFYVYGRKGQPCRVCGTPIEHFVQAQRSTFYCPHCQK